MEKRTPFCLIFFFLFFLVSTSAQKTILSGYIKSANSDEAITGAIIYTQDGSYSTFSNEYGYYSLQLLPSIVTIKVSYPGSENYQIELNLTQDTLLNISLEEKMLDEVEIVSTKIQANNPGAILNIPIKQLKQIPNIGGESDILKSLATFPGVATGAEGTSNIYVRGGTPDQNLILLDGLPVYNVSHLGGFLSVFNTDALRDVKLYKGGYPARFGGRLSSVIDIKMREGNKKEYKQELGIGLITSKFLLEGPIQKEKSSFILTGRSSYLGLINFFNDKETSDDFFNYWLYDINAKMNFSLKKGTLFFSYYTGNDYGIFKSTGRSSTFNGGEQLFSKKTIEEDKINWGNSTFSSRYILPITNKLFFKSTVGYTQYKYNFQHSEVNQEFGIADTVTTEISTKSQSTISSLIGDFGFDYTPNNKHFIRFGLNIERQGFNVANQDTISNKEKALIGVVYVEDDFKMTDKMSLNVGLRYTNFLTNQKLFSALEPRLKLTYEIGKETYLEVSFTKMTQYIHLITSLGAGFPNDLWLPATDFAPPESANQYSIGLFTKLNNNYLFSAEGFYKKSTNLLDYKVGADTDLLVLDTETWQDNIERGGKGESYGAEFFHQNKIGKMSTTLSYTLSWNYRQFENINRGNKYPFNYDRRHDISVLLNYKFNPKWQLTTNWIYQSGRRVTLPIARVPRPFENEEGVGDLEFSQRNNGKLPNYHRLDLALNFEKDTKKGNVFGWNFSTYNTYNRINPSYIFVRYSSIRNEQNEQIGQTPNIRQVSLFSFIPAFSIYFKF